MKQISRHIDSGRWEVQGGFEVEPDTHMPSGEGLARCLAIGQEKIIALKGSLSPLCWIPDVFGYSAALPQILRLGGCSQFYTTKMTWSAVTKFPYNSFVWRGADGSEVVTHLCTTGYNDSAKVDTAIQTIADHRQADVHPAQLVATGYGDGGGGPTETHIERVRRMRDLAGVPASRWITAEAFMADLSKRRDDLPVYQGELYMEYHRGTFTSQAAYKRTYRGLERALLVAEAAQVATKAGPIDQVDWQRLSFGQFHDAIPGSSIGLVYTQLNREFAERTQRLLTSAAKTVAGKAGVRVFNPLPFSRRIVVDLPEGPSLVDVPPCACVDPALAVAGAPAVKAIQDGNGSVLTNGLVEARFDKEGRLIALTVEGQDAGLAGPAWLSWFVDQPANFDAWDIDHACLSISAGDIAGVKLGSPKNGHRGSLTGRGRIGEDPFTITYSLNAGSRWLEITVDITWTARHRLLKFHVPTHWSGRQVRCGTPFGSHCRPQHSGTPEHEAMWEVPIARWAALGDDHGPALAVVTQASYGLSCKDGHLGLSLLRSSTDPDPQADQGAHCLRFALGIHRSSAGEEPGSHSTAAACDDLYTPAMVVVKGADLPPRFNWEHLGSLVPAWCQPVTEGFVLRLHETNGARGIARLVGLAANSTVTPVNFLGQALARPRKARNGTVDIPYKPYEVISLKIS